MNAWNAALKITLIAALNLAATSSFAISWKNQKALDQANQRLSLAESMIGQTDKGEYCQVSSADDALTIVKEDGFGISVDFADYDMTLKKEKRHLQLFAPTSDGHNEVSIKELFAMRKLVVTLLNEFRGIETQETCILNTKR